MDTLTTALTPTEEATLDRAADAYLAAKGKLMGRLEQAGALLQSGLHRLPSGIQKAVADRARDGLELGFRTAILGLDPDAAKRAATGNYKLGGMASGFIGGFGGFATTLAELPVTTMLIMRSVADIAREEGLPLTDPEVRAACIEVFAFGGPLEEDDDADLAFWGARLAGREVASLVLTVATRYAPALLTKLAGQAVPLMGGAVGAGLNLLYMEFYQRMARVVFALLPLERAHGRAILRAEFARRVAARRRR
ncbi:MAG: EcsC family protein [Acetobacteraceae bacterium]|nr:EcsC family protein [Acetobacteraceae bacterium]